LPHQRRRGGGARARLEPQPARHAGLECLYAE
jgi:hypothetical protein